MARYVGSIILMICAVGILLTVNLIPADWEGNGELYAKGLGVIDWSLIALAGALTAISVWGTIGVVLSNLKKMAAESALREVEISTKSWHYRLNKAVNSSSASDARSECEYWARIVHSLTHFVPLFCIVWVVVAIIMIIGWCFSARPNFHALWTGGSDDKQPFSKGYQWLGPIVFGLAVIGGTASGLMLSGAWRDIFSFRHWELAGWAFLGLILLLLAAVITWAVLCFLGRSVKKPLSFLLVRFVARACRPVKFT